MNNFRHGVRLLAAGTLMLAASLVQAQYVWIDAKGLKQFSDRPPPPSIPLKSILKAPGGVPAAASAEASAPPPADAAAATPKAAPTLAERNADYRKRGKERAELETKAREEADASAASADNCVSARAMKQTLDSGARIGVNEKNGERGFMSDAQRVLEARKVNKVLAGCT